MNTFQLECFLAVADYLNFAKAAEQMKVTQPAVTHQIQSLENELNVKLFHRTTRTVELTVAGNAFLEDARNIVELSRRAVKRFQNEDQIEILDFSIGCTTLAQLEFLPPVLERLVQLYPNLHPKILLVPSAQILLQLDEEVLDIALALKMNIKKDSLVYRELKKIPAICAFRDDHPFTGRDSVTVADVRKHKLILYHPGSASQEIVRIQHWIAETKKPSELYFCESAEAAMVLVQAGLGVAVLPNIYSFDSPDAHNRFPHIHGCPITDAGERSFGYYYKSLNGKAPVKAFIEILKAVAVKAPGYGDSRKELLADHQDAAAAS